jgi:site-specific DNA recombinase
MLNLSDDGGQVRRVAIYIRVSTEEQKIDGYSLEAQEKRLLEYVEGSKAQRLEVKGIYRDTHSGADINRENLQRLLKDVEAKKYDAVLVWKIDRLSRSLQHLLTIFEKLKDNNVSFISVQENIDFKGPIGTLIFQIFGAIAEFERELIKGRTMMGKIASAESGNFTGTSIPFGYRAVANANGKGKKLELVPEEHAWVQRMFEWYVFDGLGFGQIANKLNEKRVVKQNHKRTKRASIEWTLRMVKSIIQNPIYRGEFYANRKDEAGNLLAREKWTVAPVPASVSELLWLQAQDASEGRIGGRTGTEYLLSGKLVDVTLEKPLKFSGAKRSKGGFSYRRKQFNKDGTHFPVFEVPGKQIEEFVWDRLKEALKNPEVFIKNYLSKRFSDPTRIEKSEKELNSLRARRAEEELAIDRVRHAYEEGQYSAEVLSQRITERETAISKIDERINELTSELTMLGNVGKEVQKLHDASAQVKFRLDKLNRANKKMMCQFFIEKVDMHRTMGEDGRWKVRAVIHFQFNPEKLQTAVEMGRTQEAHGKAKHGVLNPKKVNDGGRWLI